MSLGREGSAPVPGMFVNLWKLKGLRLTHKVDHSSPGDECALRGPKSLRIAIPNKPLSVKRIIDETPSEEMATRMITVESTKPVLRARLPKSV